MKNNKKGIRLFYISCIVLLLSSCISTKKITYFQDLSASKRTAIDSIATFTEPVIHPDDVLSISIMTSDPQSVEVINQAATLQGLGTSNNLSRQEITGFPVDKNGDIELAQIGKIKVAGLTTYQAKELIRDKVSKDFKNPTVNVRFANFKISVLGEVNRPASYSFPNEKVTLLDALSLAGDLTIYGKRENILVIRDNNGVKEFARIDLNSTETFKNPYFYLKQNDAIYVEPNKARLLGLNSQTRTTVAVIISAISTLTLIFIRFR